MSESPLKQLFQLGQSPWLDFIQRSLVRSGQLDELISEWGVRGVTSNPAIFERAIGHTHEYDDAIRALAHEGRDATGIYEALALEDVREAADRFAPLHAASSGADGFVSLEVSPRLAHDTAATVAEAHRLWSELARPNVLIKVPATSEGLPAIRRLIADGISVNVTLLFSVERYRAVAEAYVEGLEERVAAGRPLQGVASVASFFLSRIDALLDPELDAIASEGGPRAERARAVRGRAALASAQRAYAVLEEILASGHFRRLAESGARPQRLLWASTGTKDPTYDDLKYVEPLIGPHTVSTMPVATLEAYQDHGRPEFRLTGNLDGARRVSADLEELGVSLEAMCERLVREGLTKFVEPFDALLRALEVKRQAALERRTAPAHAPLQPGPPGAVSREHFDAVLLDMDGVVLDSATLHAACWKRVFDPLLEHVARERGEPFEPFDVERDYRRHVDGKERRQGVRDFLRARGIELPQGTPDGPTDENSVEGLARRKDAHFRQASRRGVTAYPDAVEWIRTLRAHGLRTAIVTASHHGAELLEGAGLTELFDARVDGFALDRLGLPGKPAPDAFLEAATRLGVEPSRAVVVEDALAGVSAGRAGGFGLVVGVARHGAGRQLAAAGADRVVQRLTELER